MEIKRPLKITSLVFGIGLLTKLFVGGNFDQIKTFDGNKNKLPYDSFVAPYFFESQSEDTTFWKNELENLKSENHAEDFLSSVFGNYSKEELEHYKGFHQPLKVIMAEDNLKRLRDFYEN